MKLSILALSDYRVRVEMHVKLGEQSSEQSRQKTDYKGSMNQTEMLGRIRLLLHPLEITLEQMTSGGDTSKETL